MYASEKNIVYWYDVCSMSIEDIAKQSGRSIEEIKKIVGKTPIYKPEYAPRMRYAGWINGK
jgi:hypothetical protein